MVNLVMYAIPTLLVVFLIGVALKLFGVIDWYWWVVAMPLFGAIGIACFIYWILSNLHF